MNNIQIGTQIFVEQAWEDEAGHYHDETAEVLGIDENGRMTLKFERDDVTEWLNGADFFVEDYKDAIISNT